MFAREINNGFQLFHDSGEGVTKIDGRAGAGIYPLNNIDSEGGFNSNTGEPCLLSANYESSDGEAFIVSKEDIEKLGVEVE